MITEQSLRRGDEPLLRSAHRGWRLFRIYWIGHLISGIGDYFTLVALPIAALQLSDSTIVVGLVEFAELVATFVFGMALGALADRLHPRPVMLFTAAVRGAAVSIAAVWFWLDDPPVGVLIALSFLLGTLRNFHLSAENVMVATVVPDARLHSANARFEVSEGVGHIVGTLIAGVVTGLSIGLAFGVDALTFGAALLAMLAMGRFAAERDVEEPAEAQPPWRSAVRAVRAEDRYWRMLIVGGLSLVVSACLVGQFIAFADREIGLATWQIGITLALIGVGNIVGGIIVERAGPFSASVMLPCSALMAIATIVTGLARSWAVSSVAFLVIGIAIAIQAAVLGTHRHKRFDAGIQGRVSVVHRVVIDSILVPSVLAAGFIAERFGSGALFVTYGVIGLTAPLIGLTLGLGRNDGAEPIDEAVIDLRDAPPTAPVATTYEPPPAPIDLRPVAADQVEMALVVKVRPADDPPGFVDLAGLEAIAAALQRELDD